MNIGIDIDDSELTALVKRGQQLRYIASQRLRTTVDAIGLKLQARAQQKAPVNTGVLRRSATTTTTVTAANGLTTVVQFGGMASVYAEVQHENTSFTHTREEFARKYGGDAVIIGFGRRGRLTDKGDWKKIVASGRRRPTWSSHDDAGKLIGHKGGQSKFLHGSKTSAYDTWFQRWSEAVIDRKLLTIVGEQLVNRSAI